MNSYSIILRKIDQKKANIGIIGLGYVGLPLAILFAQKGFTVTGFTKRKERVSELGSYKSNLGDPEIDETLKKVITCGKLRINLAEKNLLQNQDILIICVPTPMTPKKKPDTTALKEVARLLSLVNLSEKLIINESTVAPFMTRNFFGGFKGNYYLVCSPERVDPGNKSKTTKDIPKIIGGINDESANLAKRLYDFAITKTIIVSSLEAAEMTKMLENSYRAVNIALVNDFAKLAEKCSIDILEVINAAATKWSFQAHFPSIGVGGHCVPKDPYYLLDLAQKKKEKMGALKLSLKTNESMPKFLLEKLLNIYKKGMKILIYGISYKKDINDLRGSPALEFCNLMKKRKINFFVYDPYFSVSQIDKLGLRHSPVGTADILVIGTDHSSLDKDYEKIINDKTIVIDGRNYFHSKVGRAVLGIGRSFV